MENKQAEIIRIRYKVLHEYISIVKSCFDGVVIKKQKNRVFVLSLKQITNKLYGRKNGKLIYATLYASAFENERWRKNWVRLQEKEARFHKADGFYEAKYNLIYAALDEFRRNRGFLPLDLKRSVPAYKQSSKILYELREMYCLGANTDNPPPIFQSLDEDEYKRYCEFIRYISCIFFGYDDALKYLATIRYLKTIYSEPSVRKDIEIAEELLVFGTDKEKREFLFDKGVDIYKDMSFPAWPDNYLNSYIVKQLDKTCTYDADGYLYIRELTGKY